MNKKFKFIDLFSGCGGFSTGFEMAGHQCLLGVDFNKDAIESFKKNHPGSAHFHGDIKKLTTAKLKSLINIKDVDVVIGGPPCQGFSTVGRGKVEDERNSLFKEFIRIVKITEPKVVVFENVTGMLAKKNKPILSKILKSFERLGYTMDARVLSAEEYGVASTRRRTIIIGTKKSGLPQFPSITHGARGKKPLVSCAKALMKLNKGKIHNHDIAGAYPQKKLDLERLKHIPDGRGIRYQKDEESLLPKKLRFDVNWNKLPESRFRQTKYSRINSKKPGPTILTSRTSYYHYKEPRYLTAREAATLQSFPKKFIFCGSTTSQFRQIGNSVPPLMAKAIAQTVVKILTSRKIRRTKNAIAFEKGAFNYNHQVQI